MSQSAFVLLARVFFFGPVLLIAAFGFAQCETLHRSGYEMFLERSCSFFGMGCGEKGALEKFDFTNDSKRKYLTPLYPEPSETNATTSTIPAGILPFTLVPERSAANPGLDPVILQVNSKPLTQQMSAGISVTHPANGQSHLCLEPSALSAAGPAS